MLVGIEDRMFPNLDVLLKYFLAFFFRCWITFLQPGTEPVPPAVETQKPLDHQRSPRTSLDCENLVSELLKYCLFSVYSVYF